MKAGLIPYSSICLWADRNGYDEEFLSFIGCIRAMDVVFLARGEPGNSPEQNTREMSGDLFNALFVR